MARPNFGKTFTSATVTAELANVEAATADAVTETARADAAADRVENSEDDAFNHAQAEEPFLSIVDGLMYPMGSKGYAAAAQADREAAQEARDAAAGFLADAETARDATAAMKDVVLTALSAVMAIGRAVYPTHDDLPASTGSGVEAWVTAGPDGDAAPGVWRDAVGGWERGSVRLAAVDADGNLLF